MATFIPITQSLSKRHHRQCLTNAFHSSAFALLFLITLSFSSNASSPSPCRTLLLSDQQSESTALTPRQALFCNDSTLATINEFIASNDFTNIHLDRVISNFDSDSLLLVHSTKVESLEWIHSNVKSSQMKSLFEQHDFLQLHHLSLHDNQLVSLVPEILNNAHSLRSLTLSRNQLTTLQHAALSTHSGLTRLDLSHNRLTVIEHNGEGLFSRHSQLVELNLSHNQIQDLSFVAFNGLAQLRQLNLSHNALNGVRFQVFRELIEIECLDLSQNQLVWFPDNFFAPNRKIQELRLNGNQLGGLSKHTLFGLKELHTLDLSDNQLYTVDRNALESLVSLRYLNLSGNQFESVSSVMFSGLGHLKVLDLSRSVFRALPNGVFTNTFELEELIIEHSSVERLGNWIARNNSTVNQNILTRLRIVRIQHNTNLKDIDGVTFASTPALEVLLLAHNRLTSLPKELGEVVGLRVLNVSGNALHSVPWQLGNLKALDTLSMMGNRFACDCRMFWLVEWLDEVARGEHADLLRSELPQLKCLNGYPGEMMPVLQQLHCTKPVTLHATESNMYRLRSDAVLECSFTGNPAPDMLWVTPTNQILRYYADPDAKPVLLEAGDGQTRITRDPIEFQMLIGANLNNYTTVSKAVGVSLLDNGALKVHNISRRDSGLYTCYGYNMIGNATANIR